MSEKSGENINGKRHTAAEQASRLAKRLCYILRYGALKEGLHADDAGFVDLKELMKVHMLRHHSEKEVLEELQTSLSGRKTKRFEIKQGNEKTLVRAVFARRFEKNPCHDSSNVKTLFESCMQTVITNLDDYDLQDFPDEFIISTMIHRLKRQKKMTNKALRALLVPTLEHLDLEGLYVMENVLKTTWMQCPHLKVLSLKDCGYIMTDSLVERLLKNLPKLESLNLAHCQHLTDRTVATLSKQAQNLQELNLSMIKTLSETAIIGLIQNSLTLKHLDIYDVRVSPQGQEKLIEIARERGLKIVLRGLQDNEVAPNNPCLMLPNFGKRWF